MNSFKLYLSKPQLNVARWCDSIAIFIAGLCSLYFFYFIEFNFCRDYECENLVVTGFFAAAPWWYLLFGLSLLGVGAFVYRTRDLPRIFAIVITVSSLAGFVLSGMIVFAMLREAKLIA
jgi:hypothetical protein